VLVIPDLILQPHLGKNWERADADPRRVRSG
jgi:hypothetical protein